MRKPLNNYKRFTAADREILAANPIKKAAKLLKRSYNSAYCAKQRYGMVGVKPLNTSTRVKRIGKTPTLINIVLNKAKSATAYTDRIVFHF